MKKYFWPALFVANLAAIIGIWYWGTSGALLREGGASAVIAVGRLCGLVAEYFILTQLVLVGRLRVVEPLYGHDKLNDVHRFFGKCIAIVLLAHPTFLALGYSMLGDAPFLSQVWDFLMNWDGVLKAFTALFLIGAIVAVSLVIVRKRLRYETWYSVHLFTYLAIWLAFEHQTETADVSAGAALGYWLTLNYAVFGLLVLYRFARPIYLFWKHRFSIERVVAETPAVTSIYVSGRKMDRFAFEPGQFANWTFLSKGMWNTHPFSFSAAPNGESLRVSVKSVGDFTARVRALKPGTKVVVDGPLGAFTAKKAETGKYLFIAGGIGITPIRSMIERLAREGKDLVLLYGNRTVADIALRSELERMAPEKVTHVLSDEVRDGYESGRIDEEMIRRLVPDFDSRDAYVCGPPPMMDGVTAALMSLGVPKRRIHFERFSY